MGIYPCSVRSFWPAPIALSRNAFTAVPTWESWYFEHTISYVASTIGYDPVWFGRYNEMGSKARSLPSLINHAEEIVLPTVSGLIAPGSGPAVVTILAMSRCC